MDGKIKRLAMLNFLEEHFSQAYYYQHDRKENIFSSLTLPTSVIIVLIGAIFYYINILIPISHILNLKCAAVIALLLSSACIIFASYNILRAAHDNTYEYIASPLALHKYAQDLKRYYTQENHANPVDAAKQDLKKELVSQYARSESRNVDVNEKRLYYRNCAFKAIRFAVIFLTLTAILNVLSINTVRGEHNVERSIRTGIGLKPASNEATVAEAEAEASVDASSDRRCQTSKN